MKVGGSVMSLSAEERKQIVEVESYFVSEVAAALRDILTDRDQRTGFIANLNRRIEQGSKHLNVHQRIYLGILQDTLDNELG